MVEVSLWYKSVPHSVSNSISASYTSSIILDCLKLTLFPAQHVFTENTWFVSSMRTRCWSWPRRGQTMRRLHCYKVYWKMPIEEKMNWRQRTGQWSASQQYFHQNIHIHLWEPHFNCGQVLECGSISNLISHKEFLCVQLNVRDLPH